MSKYNPPAYPPATYDAGPYNPAGSPPPGQYYQAPPPAQQGYYGGPLQQGPYGGPPQQYGGPPPQQGMYYQQGPPQGGYIDNRGRKGGMGGESCLAGCLGALACCCCLDFLF